MKTYDILSTKERYKVLDYILNRPEEEFKVRDISRKIKLSPSHVSKTLKILKKEGIIKNNKLNRESPLVKSLKILINIKKLDDIKLVKISRRTIKNVIGIGVYGSWVSGTNYEDSDLDIWIKSEKPIKEPEVAKLNSYLIKKLKMDVSILTLWPEKIDKLKKDNVFYHSLVFGSFVLWGEGID
ncbi:MAG: ArsR family transcriptional regulator [Candidatus Aenigmarchaeota archaeon]|nr:ArsR family transcriptional regulator [Candidatus Aenigmarchaeota archaeon]